MAKEDKKMSKEVQEPATTGTDGNDGGVSVAEMAAKNAKHIAPGVTPVEKEKGPIILAVDDDRTMLLMLESRLTKQGYRVAKALNGKSACTMIEKHHDEIDTVLLDRVMPDMDGLEVVKWLQSRKDLTQMPIVMQTGADTPEQIREGIDAGVFYYLTKPIQPDVLKSIVASAVRESKQNKLLREEMKRHRISFQKMQSCKFVISNLDEAENVSCFVANCFPDPNKVMPGIAELMINAIEHGKCKITYEDKSKLIDTGKWREEVNRRCNMTQLAKHTVDIVFNRTENQYFLKISDNGDGFAWHKYMHVDPARALDNHGRGIARTNMLFDKLQYNKTGNEVIAVIDPGSRANFEW